MSYATDRRTRLLTQLANVQAALTNFYTQMTETSTSSVESYSLDSGEGSQRVTRRKLSEIQSQIEKLEATETWLINELSGVGHISIKLRRITPCRGYKKQPRGYSLA